MAPPVDTRLGPGTLTIGGVERGAQISNVSLEPSQDSNDGTPTLGDPDPLPQVSESWVLKGEAVQDFEEPAGFVNYCMVHALDVVAFEWVPNSAAGVKFTGNVLVTSVPIGGDVAAQNTSPFEFAVQGDPTRTEPAGVSRAGRAARRDKAKSSRRKTASSSPPPAATSALVAVVAVAVVLASLLAGGSSGGAW